MVKFKLQDVDRIQRYRQNVPTNDSGNRKKTFVENDLNFTVSALGIRCGSLSSHLSGTSAS